MVLARRTNVDFLCDLTYDPFVTMAQSRKRYGWAVVFKEFGITVPSLFEITSDIGRATDSSPRTMGYFLAHRGPHGFAEVLYKPIQNRDSNATDGTIVTGGATLK